MRRAAHLLALLASGTLVVCGVKAPPRPPEPSENAAPDAGGAPAQQGSTLECPLEARQALERARLRCPEAQLDDSCRISCASPDGGAP